MTSQEKMKRTKKILMYTPMRQGDLLDASSIFQAKLDEYKKQNAKAESEVSPLEALRARFKLLTNS